MNKILLVEDNRFQRKKLRILLESHQFVVEEAEDFKSASQKVEKKKFDVFVLLENQNSLTDG